MAKPVSLPRWAETVGGVPDANIVEPNEGKKDTGYTPPVLGVGDIPTSGGLNWILWLLYKWIEWVNAAASLATASVLVVRDAAGRFRAADPLDVADVDTLGARDGAITTHNAVTNPHSATAAATASRLVLRDAAGRAAVADPSAAGDIDTKGARDAAVAALSSADTLTAGTGWTLEDATKVKKTGSLVVLELLATAGASSAWNSIATLSVGFRSSAVQGLMSLGLIGFASGGGSRWTAAFNITNQGVIQAQTYQTGSAGLVALPTIATGDEVRLVVAFSI